MPDHTRSRKQPVKKALKTSEEVLRKTLDNFYDAVFIHDVHGKILDVNNKMLRLYGVTKEQALSFSIIDDYSTSDNSTANLKGIWENIIASDHRIFEWKARRPLDGSTFDVEVYLTKITMQNQDLVLATVRDITERKKVERQSTLKRDMALGLAKARSLNEALPLCLETAIELAEMDSGGIYLIDTQSGDLSLVAGKNLTDQFYQTVKTVPVNSTPWELTMRGDPLYFIADSHGMPAELQKVFSREGLKAMAFIPIKHMDQVIGCFNVASHVSDTISFLQRNLLETLVAHLGNVISNLRISEELIASERKYRNIFEHAVEGIFQTTPDGRLVSANPAYARIYGYASPEELLKEVRSIGDQLYARQGAREELLLVLEQQDEVRNYEIEGLKKNGDSIWCSLNMRIVRDDAGKIPYYEGTAADITKRKKAEDELKIKSINLEEVNAALKVLLKQREQDKNELEEKVLHNMKELIMPYLEKMKETRLDDRQKTYLDIIETNLRNIISPFIQRITHLYGNFTPTEIKVANFIKEGKTVKDISKILGVSPNSVNLHRQNIRNKLSLNSKKIGLRTYLMSFT